MPNSPIASTYTQTLTQAGLSAEQAQIYEILLKNGPSSARKVAQNTPLKRSLVYKILDDLIKLGLVEKADAVGKISIFTPAHPLKLKEFVERQEQKAKTAQTALSDILGQLTSDFNLASNKPGVKFYEGLEGIKQVLDDSLKSKTEIYSYADIESIVKYIDQINKDYVAKRNRLTIKKKGIVSDTPFTRDYLRNYHKNITETRFIKSDSPLFQTVMQIYDGKISYITLGPDQMIGVIIADQHIYQTHKYLFEFVWGAASQPDNDQAATSALV